MHYMHTINVVKSSVCRSNVSAEPRAFCDLLAQETGRDGSSARLGAFDDIRGHAEDGSGNELFSRDLRKRQLLGNSDPQGQSGGSSPCDLFRSNLDSANIRSGEKRAEKCVQVSYARLARKIKYFLQEVSIAPDLAPFHNLNPVELLLEVRPPLLESLQNRLLFQMSVQRIVDASNKSIRTVLIRADVLELG